MTLISSCKNFAQSPLYEGRVRLQDVFPQRSNHAIEDDSVVPSDLGSTKFGDLKTNNTVDDFLVEQIPLDFDVDAIVPLIKQEEDENITFALDFMDNADGAFYDGIDLDSAGDSIYSGENAAPVQYIAPSEIFAPQMVPTHETPPPESPIPKKRRAASIKKESYKKMKTEDSDSDHNWVPDISSPRARHNVGRWNEEEDRKLRHGMKLYRGNWKAIAEYVGTRTAQQCLHRWRKSVQPGISRSRWQPYEDDLLRAAVESCGPHWTAVKKLVPGRTDVQCRERWVNVLDPRICHDPWTPQEDAQLKRLVKEIGHGKWSIISQHLERRRTDYACRKRWEKLCRRAHAR